MGKSKYSITFTALIGYVLLSVFGAATIWFIYNKVVELDKHATTKDSSQKMVLIGKVATRLYTAEGLSRSIIQNKETNQLSRYYSSIDSVSLILDSLKTLYPSQVRRNELDSINHLLMLKKENLDDLLDLRKKNTSENYYDRVLKRLENADYLFGSLDYKEMVKDLKPYQQEVVIDFLKYAEEDNADRLTNRTADELIETMKKVLLKLELQEHRYQQTLAKKEEDLLANDLKISEKLRKIRSKIEQEAIQKSLGRMKSTQETLDQTSHIMIVFGIACVLTILIFIILIIRDVSKSRRNQLALEEAKTFAEGLLKSREQILATVTHDLRSPLNSIIGYSDLMRKTNLLPKQKTYLRQLQKSSNYTIRLVNDLLDFSRLEAGKIRIEQRPFIPENLIIDVVDENIPATDVKHLQITYDLPEVLQSTFLSDPFRIKQILANLIGNAYKFTKEGELSVIGKLAGEKEKTNLLITVKDSGIGISKSQQKVIFDEFSQAESSTEKKYGGSGLGLAISKKLALLLGGDITVESEIGKGSRFTLKIPVKPTEKSAVSREKKTKEIKLSKGHQQHALVIDDDKTQLDLTRHILLDQGFKVTTAADGRIALNKVEEYSFDIILTDIQMPKVDGFAFVNQFRTIQGKQHLPVIALSGESGKKKEFYINAGFDDYLLKPYDTNKLLSLMARYLQIDLEKVSSLENEGFSSVNNTSLFDLQDLQVFTDSDPAALLSILQTLLKDMTTNLARLNEAKIELDREKIAFVAHKMLPMLRQIKANETIMPLQKLERQNNIYSDDKIGQLVDQATIKSREVIKELKEDVAALKRKQ